MPSGSAVIRYAGQRGVSWRIKYRDGSGKQVMETLGKSPEWNRRKAGAALRHRLADVEREGYTRPEKITFENFALGWLDAYPVAQSLKTSTVEGYTYIVRTHLVPEFGREDLNAIDVPRIERYIARKRRAGLSGRTLNRHLNLLGLIFRAAKREGLARSNPVSEVERPRETETEWRVLDPIEVRAVETAFRELIAEAEDEAEREWRETCRVMFLLVAETGLRRGEVCGLRWRALSLADPEGATLRVAETWVRGRTDGPKSRAGRRTIPISSTLAAELFDHRLRAAYQADDNLVFCSSYRGSHVNPKRYAETFRTALAKAEIMGYVRPFHDGRHSAITNAARAGRREHALMTLAGHSDSRTTKLYTHLAGEMFRNEAARMGASLWGEVEKAGRNSESEQVVEARDPA